MLPPLLLFLLACAVYLNSFPGSFILDDLPIVQHNPLVAHPSLAAIFSSDYWHPYYGSGLFRPLTILSLAVNRMVFGPAPWGFHLVNLLLHGIVTVLLWQVLRAWQVSAVAALAAAGIFALHPIHTEVVNEAVGRSELLVAALLLAALWCSRQPRIAAQVGVALCYLLALAAKEHAVVLLALLPLWTLFSDGAAGVRRRWPLYLALLSVTGGWLLWRQLVAANALPHLALAEAAAPLAFLDASGRVLSALAIQGLYLVRLATAVGLQAVYSPGDLPLITGLLTAPALVVISGATLGAALIVVGWRRQSLIACFALFYVVCFLPTSSLFFPIGVSMAERLAYTPSLWFCAALGVLVEQGWRNERWRGLGLVVTLGYLLWLGGVTWSRNRDFASPEALWRAEIAHNPEDYLAWQSLATNLAAQGRDAEAEQGYRRMLAIAPEYPGGLRRLVSFYLERGRLTEALPYAQKVLALSLAEDDPHSTAFDALQLATLQASIGAYDQSLALLEGAAEALREQERAREVRALALSGLGRDDEAVALFATLALGPEHAALRSAYGKSLLRLGQSAEARVQLQAAVASGAGAEEWNLLGVACAQQLDWPAALAAFTQAVTLQPDHRGYRDNLQRATTSAAALQARPAP